MGLPLASVKFSQVIKQNQWKNPKFGGANRDRTDDPLLAKQVLSQLSYSPLEIKLGGSGWT